MHMTIVATWLTLKCQLSLLLLLLLFEKRSRVTNRTNNGTQSDQSRWAVQWGKSGGTMMETYPSVPESQKTVSWHGTEEPSTSQGELRTSDHSLAGCPGLQP